jgi:hypothetical protein
MAMLGLNASNFRAGLNQAQSMARSAGNRIGSSLGGAISGQLAGFASAAALTAFAKNLVDTAGHIVDLAGRTGMSTAALQEWDYALKQSGASIDGAVPFFEKLIASRKKALQGNNEMIASFRQLGVSIEDLKTKGASDLATQIAKAFESGNAEDLITSLREVGGRGAGQLVAAFANGIEGLRAEARKVGAIIDDEALQKLDELGDNMESIWATVKAAAAPVLVWITDTVMKLLDSVKMVSTWLGTFVSTGSFFKADEAATKFAGELADKEQAKRRERANGGRRGRGTGAGEPDETDKEAKTQATELKRLQKTLYDQQFKNWYDQLSREQKMAVLKKTIADNDVSRWIKLTDKEKVQKQIAAEEAKEKLRGLENQKPKTPKAANRSEIGVNELQKIGAYTSVNADTGILNVNKEMATSLKKIEAAVTKPGTNTGPKF